MLLAGVATPLAAPAASRAKRMNYANSVYALILCDPLEQSSNSARVAYYYIYTKICSMSAYANNSMVSIHQSVIHSLYSSLR